MATATDVGFTADHVLAVLKKASEPQTTLGVTLGLAKMLKCAPEQVPVTRLRRALERLLERGEIVASGGPKRNRLPGWPIVDGRDVLWATKDVADLIERDHAENVAKGEAARKERADLLRDLHSKCLTHEREALGLVGLLPALRDHIDYVSSEGGATTWTLEELRAVADLIDRAGAK